MLYECRLRPFPSSLKRAPNILVGIPVTLHFTNGIPDEQDFDWSNYSEKYYILCVQSLVK